MVHVIQNPAGTFSLVGMIPRELCDECEPTKADVLGSRVDMTTRKVYRPKVFKTAQEAFAAIDATEYACNMVVCACTRLRREIA